jgi:hypothetical protein
MDANAFQPMIARTSISRSALALGSETLQNHEKPDANAFRLMDPWTRMRFNQ